MLSEEDEDQHLFNEDCFDRSTSDSEIHPASQEQQAKQHQEQEQSRLQKQKEPSTEERKKKLSLALQIVHDDSSHVAESVGGGGSSSRAAVPESDEGSYPSTSPPPVPSSPHGSKQQHRQRQPSSGGINLQSDSSSNANSCTNTGNGSSSGNGSINSRPYLSSKSYEEPPCATSPFGEVHNTRWSKSLADELASLSFIDATEEGLVAASPSAAGSTRKEDSPVEYTLTGRQRSFSGGGGVCRLTSSTSASSSSSTSSTTLMVMPNKMKKSHTHHSLALYTCYYGSSGNSKDRHRRISSSSCSTLGQLARHDDGVLLVDGEGEEEELFLEIADEGFSDHFATSTETDGTIDASSSASSSTAAGGGAAAMPSVSLRVRRGDSAHVPPLGVHEDDESAASLLLPMKTSYSQDHAAGAGRRHCLVRQSKVDHAAAGRGQSASRAPPPARRHLEVETPAQKKKRSKTLSF